MPGQVPGIVFSKPHSRRHARETIVSLRLRMITFVVLAIAAIFGAGAIVTAIVVGRIEAAHPPSGRFIAVTGGRLHVLELSPPAGIAEDRWPVVLVHGASSNLEDLRLALGDRLAANRRVILVDRPGLGWSDRPDGAADASPVRQATLIAEALDRMGVERFVLVAHSLGGAIATAFALAYPDRLAGLVLIAPVTHPWVGGLAWYNAVLSAPIAGAFFARTLALPLGELLLEGGGTAVFAPQRMPPDYINRAAIRLLLRPSRFISNAQDVAVLKAYVIGQAPHYQDIATPTVVLTGTADGIVSPSIHAPAFAAALPHARLVLLDGVGHMPHYAATDAVVEAIDSVSMRPPPALAAPR
jgi:pimeloyl-ACP methyl ester carboxylesterase